jgi:hypothetical protein
VGPGSPSSPPRRLRAPRRAPGFTDYPTTSAVPTTGSATAWRLQPSQPPQLRPFPVGRSGALRGGRIARWARLRATARCRLAAIPSPQAVVACAALPGFPPLPPTPRWAASLRWPSSTSWSPWRPPSPQRTSACWGWARPV